MIIDFKSASIKMQTLDPVNAENVFSKSNKWP